MSETSNLPVKDQMARLERIIPDYHGLICTGSDPLLTIEAISFNRICTCLLEGITLNTICNKFKITMGDLKYWILSDNSRYKTFHKVLDMIRMDAAHSAITEGLSYDLEYDEFEENAERIAQMRLEAAKLRVSTASGVDKSMRSQSKDEDKDTLPTIHINFFGGKPQTVVQVNNKN